MSSDNRQLEIRSKGTQFFVLWR
uniref:Uncharacterized protein n=1 Tax=Anguilla anguilla TaxID=7936 RepID=A0A0E9SW02_ANGAN